MSPEEITDRANMLALELRRIAVAHLDAIPKNDAETIEIMAVAIALADVFRDVRARAGMPPRTPAELVSYLVKTPFDVAAKVAMAPDRPR